VTVTDNILGEENCLAKTVKTHALHIALLCISINMLIGEAICTLDGCTWQVQIVHLRPLDCSNFSLLFTVHFSTFISILGGVKGL